MSARTVRRLTAAVCVAGIVGMILMSVLDHSGAAITFGLITAVAVLCSMVATTVSASTVSASTVEGAVVDPPTASGSRSEAASEELAVIVERKIHSLVEAGADEVTIRSLVGEAVRLGRSLPTEARP